MFERHFYSLDDRANRLCKTFSNLAFADHQFLRYAVHQIAAFNFHHTAISVGGHASRPDVLFDPLGTTLTDQKVMIASDIGDDRLIHLITADTYGSRIDNPTKGQHSNFRSATADIDNHRARGLGNRQPCSDRGGHRLFDQKDSARACAFGRFLNGSAFDRSRPRWNTNDHLWTRKAAAIMHLANEVLDHFFGDFKVRDHTVTERSNGFDIPRRTTKHQLCFVTNSQNLPPALDIRDRHHGRFVQHDSPTSDVY